MRYFWTAVVLSCFITGSSPVSAQRGFGAGGSSHYQAALDRLQAMTSVPVREWRFHAADMPHPEDPSLDDASWQTVTLGGFQRGGGGRGAGGRGGGALSGGPSWYRAWVEIPPTAGGRETRGARVRLAVRLFGDGRVFFNGVVVAQGDGRLLDPILIADQAVPGQKVLVAVNTPLHATRAGLAGAQLLIDRPADPIDPDLLRTEIVSTEALLAGFPDGAADRQRQLDAAVQAIDFAVLDRGDQQAFSRSLEAAQSDLQPLRNWMQQFTVQAAGNSHIDMAWLWPWTETVEVVRDTFSTALQLMREYPGFTYTQSSAQDFAWLEEKYPDLFRQIQERVKEGRWEIVGGMWVEPDLNMPDGESLVRQLLVGKRYFRQKFGVDVKIGWNPDSFGYNWQLPQIYKKSGIDYFVTQKISWNDTTRFPYKLFWWEAPDGSKILTYFPPGYGGGMNPVEIARDVATYAPSTHFPGFMYLYGVGDHGGGPTRSMLDQALQMRRPSAVFPRLAFGTAQGFFDEVQKRESDLQIPTWKDELYLEFHRGVLTTQSETKKRIREDEELLQNAEKFAALSFLDGQAYPGSRFEDCWKRVLFDQFHDIMPGSGIAVNYEDAAANLHEVHLQGEQILHEAMDEITTRVDTEGAGIPAVIYNPLSWPRTGPVELEVQFPAAADGAMLATGRPARRGDGAKRQVSFPRPLPPSSRSPRRPVASGRPVAPSVAARDSSGKPLLVQIVSTDASTHRARVRVLARDVPPFGYEVIHLLPARSAQPAASPLRASGTTLENEFLRVTVDPKTGCITSLFNKVDRREALAPGTQGNLLQAFADNPRQFDAWNIDADFEKQHWDLNEAQEVKLVESGPVRAVIRVKKRFQNSTFVQEICLYPGVSRVDVHMQADWHEKHILLKVAFPASVQSDFATYEIPYGTIRRPTTRRTPAEQAKFEVPALRWGDLSDASHGFSLLNASKYGYDAKGNTLRLSLLRSPANPDPHADEGFHEFTYALYPHRGDWQTGQSMQRAYELNFPMIPVVTSPHGGALPQRHSFAQIEPGNVILTVLKKAEDEDALILRYYEFAGKSSQVRLRLPEKATRAVETNLMEKEERTLPLAANGRELTIPTGPYEIKTVKVWWRR